MYILPRSSKCNKCGHEESVSVHENPLPFTLYGEVPCPCCFAKMVSQFCGVMEPIEAPTPSAPPGGRS